MGEENKRPGGRELTEEQIRAVGDGMVDVGDMAMGTGKHEGHTLRQIGRCVYCSCGGRYQGAIPKDRDGKGGR